MINTQLSKTTHKTLDYSSKEIQRRLAVFFTNDLAPLKRAFSEVLAAHHPLAKSRGGIDASLPPIASVRQVVNTAPPTGRDNAQATITWTNESDGSERMNIEVRVLSCAQLLDPSAHRIDYLQAQPVHMLYVVEGAPATITPGVASMAPRPVSRTSICIASGEHVLFNELKEIMRRIYPNQPNAVQMRPMHSGDITWIKTVKDPDTGEEYDDVMCNFLIERKDKEDFIATHFRKGDDRSTQLAVMMATVPSAERIFYVIEGDVLDTRSAADPKAKFSKAVLPAIRDGIRVVNTQSTRATAHFLVNMHLMMEYCEESHLHQKPLVLGNRLITAPKKADFINPDGRQKFIHMLTGVLDVSDAVAIAINAVYPTFASLVNAFKAHQPADEAPFMLQDIRVAGGKRESRRLGPALSEKIFRYFEIESIGNAPKEVANSTDDDTDEDDDDDNNNNNNNNNNRPRVHAPTKKRPGPVFEKAKKAYIERMKKQSKKPRVEIDVDDDDN